MKKVKGFFFKAPIWSTVIYSSLAALVFGTYILISYKLINPSHFSLGDLITGFTAPFLVALPVILTIENILLIFSKRKDEQTRWNLKMWELVAISIGTLFSLFWLFISQIKFSDWQVQLENAERHTPINTEAVLTFSVIMFLAAVAYLVLSFWAIDKMPPLFAVLCISALYLGMAESILWCIQILDIRDMYVVFLYVLPFNLSVIGIRTIKDVVEQQAIGTEEIENVRSGGEVSGRLGSLRLIIKNSRNWPWLAFLAAIPLLGVISAILILFGQRPDSFIRVWTETADWNMSEKIAPQNIYIDEHYLCTVAAGGHKAVVKPIRIGKRHRHRVVVNRQLCIANAFEQLLEERTPNFHRLIRKFYDKTGYPIAKHIRSPYVADAIYYAMKPLEWVFLACLYLLDTKPENRIAVQYPHTDIPDPDI